jgi:hypothetical protein
MNAYLCPICGTTNAIVNQCGCDPNNLPTVPDPMTPQHGDWVTYYGRPDTKEASNMASSVILGGYLAERGVSEITGNPRYRVVDEMREATTPEAGRWIGIENVEAIYAPGESRRRVVRVTYANDDTVTTEINGTEAEIRRYYLGNQFNLGIGPDDNLQTAVAVDFIDSPAEPVGPVAAAVLSELRAVRSQPENVAPSVMPAIVRIGDLENTLRAIRMDCDRFLAGQAPITAKGLIQLFRDAAAEAVGEADSEAGPVRREVPPAWLLSERASRAYTDHRLRNWIAALADALQAGHPPFVTEDLARRARAVAAQDPDLAVPLP